jgi:MFS family permease
LERENNMETKTKLGLGSVLAMLGAMGMILAPTLGATALARPWSFLAGFLVGVVCGLGVALTVAGLLEHRRQQRMGAR